MIKNKTNKENINSSLKTIRTTDKGTVFWRLLVNTAEEIDILDNENSKSLSKRLSQLGANNINHNIHLILNNKAKFIDQNDKQATYAKKIEKIEGKINWNSNAENIQAKIEALK